jgi:hypothetical protein
MAVIKDAFMLEVQICSLVYTVDGPTFFKNLYSRLLAITYQKIISFKFIVIVKLHAVFLVWKYIFDYRGMIHMRLKVN